jgi:hypothetical protein
MNGSSEGTAINQGAGGVWHNSDQRNRNHKFSWFLNSPRRMHFTRSNNKRNGGTRQPNNDKPPP